MADSFVIKQGDTLPALQRTLKDSAGTAIDLTSASSVVFRMTVLGGSTPKVERACSVVGAATNGVVSLTWQAGDTDTVGVYRGEFEVTFGTDKLTVPNSTYMTVSVVKELG